MLNEANLRYSLHNKSNVGRNCSETSEYYLFKVAAEDRSATNRK